MVNHRRFYDTGRFELHVVLFSLLLYTFRTRGMRSDDVSLNAVVVLSPATVIGHTPMASTVTTGTKSGRWSTTAVVPLVLFYYEVAVLLYTDFVASRLSSC